MSSRGAGQRGLARVFVHLGMLAASLAFTSWWTTHTILDTGRTQRVADAVLGNAELRHYLADKIAPAVAGTVSESSINSALAAVTGTTVAPSTPTQSGSATASSASASADALASQLSTVLDRPEVRNALEQFLVTAHARLIGQGTGPAVIDQATVHALVGAAVPSLPASEVATIPAVTIDVPRQGLLASGAKALRDRFGWFLLAAAGFLVAALLVSRDRRGVVALIGRWLVGISLGHLMVLWIIPVVIAPHLSNSPWVGLISGVARAMGSGIVVGLVVLVAVGLACMGVDHLLPATSEPGSGSSPTVPGQPLA